MFANSNTSTPLSAERLRCSAEEVDARFEANRRWRAPTEAKWSEHIRAIGEGRSPKAELESLVSAYTDLADPTLPTGVRLACARSMAFLEGRWFRLHPTAGGESCLELHAAVESYLHLKFRANASGLYNALSRATFQLACLNVSGLQYAWIKGRGYQGPRVEYINMFNCYPDLLHSPESDLNEVDLFHLEVSSSFKLQEDIRLRADADTLFCDLSILDELDNHSTQVNQSQARIGRQPKALRNTIELRTAYLRELSIDDYNIEKLTNVTLIYVKAKGGIHPLVLRQNSFAFEDKPIRLYQDWVNPYEPYAPGGWGLAVNQHLYAVYLRALKAYTAGKALMPSELIPSTLRRAFLGSEDEFYELFNRPGGQGFYNPDKLTPGKDRILRLNGEDKASADIELLAGELRNVKGDLADFDLEIRAPLEGTASGVRDAANRQDIISRNAQRELAENALRPMIAGCVEAMRNHLSPENVRLPLKPTEAKFASAQRDGRLWRSVSVPSIKDEYGTMRIPFGIAYDASECCKKFTLNRPIMAGFAAEVDVQISGNDYSKPHELEVFGNLYGNILRNATPGPARDALAKIALSHLNELTGNKYAKSIEQNF